MKTLITPAQVAAMAFGPAEIVNEAAVGESAILSAERKFIRPVLGAALYDELLAGGHAAFVKEYLQAPLALYVKWLVLPVIAVQCGNMGLVQLKTGNFVPASEQTLRSMRRRVKSEARELMLRAVEYVEADPAAFPAYDPRENVLRRVSTSGGVVL